MHTPCGRATGKKKTLQTTFLLIILFESFECRVASLITKRLARAENVYRVCVCMVCIYDGACRVLFIMRRSYLRKASSNIVLYLATLIYKPNFDFILYFNLNEYALKINNNIIILEEKVFSWRTREY